MSPEKNGLRNILVADDHGVTRRGVQELIREAFEPVEIAEAASGPAVLAQLGARPWDLIILDLFMPGGNIVDIIGQIRARDPVVPILVLTFATEIEHVVQTMKAGANGFVHKHLPVDEVIDAIRKVSGGGMYLPGETAAAIARSAGGGGGMLPHQRLSERELDIFRRVAIGQSVKEVAGQLGISDKTVATYLLRIREKTGLATHVEIARYALRHGVVE
jgi:two-component system, NarL family, invasion response regulator UvrY